MFKDDQWCSKHSCAYTGFTSLYCPRCEEEKSKPAPALSGHDHVVPGTAFPESSSRLNTRVSIEGEIISWGTNKTIKGDDYITGKILTNNTKVRFNILEPVLIAAFIAAFQHNKFQNVELVGIAHRYGNNPLVIRVKKFSLKP